jgi:glycosyltransferase involved in cell wall biosynthesis
MYHVNPSLVEFLPMGVDDEAIPANRVEIRELIRKELGMSESDILVMTGGKIEMRKNTHYLYEAMEKIADSRLHLVVCGTFTPSMKFLEEKMKTRKNIHLLGWCNAQRVMNVMVASDFVCFPGTHSTLWEQSVGVGLPGIFKHWDEIDHVNVNGNCIFVKGDDVDEIVSAINKLLDKDTYLVYKSLSEKASAAFLYSEIAKKSICYE